MPDWAHRTTFRLHQSITAEELPEPSTNYVEDPVLTLVQAQPSRYWILTGDIFTLMDPAARDAVDAAELAARRDDLSDEIDRTETFMRAFALVVLDEVNLLRALHALPDRTIVQLKTAVRGKLDV